MYDEAWTINVQDASISDIDRYIKHLERIRQEKMEQYKTQRIAAVYAAVRDLANDYPEMNARVNGQVISVNTLKNLMLDVEGKR